MKRTLIIPLLLATAFCQAQTQISAEDALKLASANRASIAAFRLRVEQTRLSARALGALPPLTIAAGASTRSEIGATDQDFALTQEIDLFGRTRAQRQVSSADVMLAVAQYRREAGLLQSEVLVAFATAVSARHQRDVADELLVVAEGLLNATKRRFEEGKVAELQVTRATVEYERAKQSTELKNADYQASMTRLASLVSVPVEQLLVEADATIELLAYPSVVERPDILELQAEAEKAKAEAELARAASRPTFSVQAVRSPWGVDRGYFVGRAQFSWSLWDHGRSRNEVKAANLRTEAAKKSLADATALATQELVAIQRELESRQARIKSYELILASAKELVAKSHKGFSEGFGTQIDVLEATRALREVEQELVEARQQLSLTVIKQYEAAGFLAEVLK
ncbi:MAG: TolC family protein [Fimbriimonadaceae bacterium]|nr:TolC family protein [Fimbriimonadaceae bacterium]QYK58155.1 MAG: TolC family protein [Fimbriimonadaceae bacterium]